MELSFLSAHIKLFYCGDFTNEFLLGRVKNSVRFYLTDQFDNSFRI